MPGNKPRRKRRRSRLPKMVRENMTRGTIYAANNQPFPDAMITKHRYVVTDTLDPGIGTPDVKYYNCVGLYDPEAAAGGHQPLGFDEMTTLYDHYNVLGATIKVRAVSGAADVGSGATMIGCYINDDTTGVTTYDELQEQGRAVSRLLTGNTANGIVHFRKSFDTKKYFGVNDIADSDKLKGSISANPTDGAYFAVFAQGMVSGSNPSTVYLNLEIEYTVKWTERRSLVQS